MNLDIRCGNCCFYRETRPRTQAYEIGFCHLKPPVIPKVFMETREEVGFFSSSLSSKKSYSFPEVSSNDFCPEFKNEI